MHWTDRLSEYLDDELPRDERAACEAHLAGCGECRGVLDELRAVTATARADVDRMPTDDLWPGILARLDRQADVRPFVRPAQAEAAERPARRQITFSLPQLALAASFLIAVSAGVSYVATGRMATETPRPPETPIQAVAEPIMAPSADVTRANFADAQYDQAVLDLERILIDQREHLDPRTVVIIERNLAAINAAIRQARAALDADPANTYLNSHLADARRRKLELLRRATMLSGAGD